MNATQKSYEASASAYAKKVADLLPAQEAKKFLSLLPLKPAILDIGCGPGRDAQFFSECECSVVGIDFSQAMIDLAKQTAPKAVFHQMDIAEISFPKCSFDGAWASASLLHISKAQIPTVLKKIHVVLKPNGVFYLSVKMGDGEAIEKDERYGGLEKFWSYFQENEIAGYLVKAGFLLQEMSVEEKRSSYQTHSFIRIFCQKNL